MPTPFLLNLNTRGPDVAALQAKLAQIGYKLPKAELDQQLFGVGTQAAMLALQTKYQLRPSGALDAATATALATAVAAAGEAHYRVSGRAFLESGLPAVKMTVRPYNRLFAVDEPVRLNFKKNGGSVPSEAVTDDQGFYEILYDPETQPVNLELRVVDSQAKEVTICDTRFEVDKQETINFVAPAQVKPLAPEYARLTGDLTKLGVQAKLGDAQEKDQRQDITWLSQATKWDGRLLAMAATATKLSALTGVKTDILYALFRVGLPTDKGQLARVSSAAIDKALTKATDAGIISLTPQEKAAATTAMGDFARAARRALKTSGAPSSFGDLLNKSGVPAPEQAKFEELYFSHQGSGAELWKKAAAAGLSAASIGKLQLQGKLSLLTLNNADLAASLQPIVGSVDQLPKLVDTEHFKEETWTQRLNDLAGNNEQKLNTLIPPAYTGAKSADRLAAYAGDLARKVRLSFPTHVAAHRIDKDELKLGSDHAALKAPVLDFLKNGAPLGFRLGGTRIDAFIRDNRNKLFGNNPQPKLVADTARGIKRLQRAYQVTPSDEALNKFLELGFTSARDVLAFPYDEFIKRFGLKFAPDKKASLEIARLVYRKCEQVGAVTFNFLAGAKQLVSTAPAPSVMAAPDGAREVARTALIKQYPTLETLFGSLDFCECEHCRSVFSPAAYLVDLLQFLEPEDEFWKPFVDQWKVQHGGASYPFADPAAQAAWAAKHPTEPNPADKKPYETLIGRRPDIPNLPLTCENTTTALPYIDVANEILEYYVANGKLGTDAVHDTGSATTPELLAEPQYFLPAAYTVLNGPQAHYPLTLPFDLPLETTRAFLDHFGISVADILDLFRTTEDLATRTPIVAESLGITPSEYDIITDPTPLAKWYELYGYTAENTALLELKSAKTLSLRLGVTYKELADILRTRFINPRLEALTIIRKIGVELDDLCRYKTAAGYQPFTPEETTAFEERLTDLAGQFNPKLADPAKLAKAKTWLDAAWQQLNLSETLRLVDPDANCNFEQTVVQFADKKTDIDRFTLLKINLFVRLSKRLGWTMGDVDCALRAFIPSKSDPLTAANIAAALKTVMLYLAHLSSLNDRLKLGRNSLQELLTFWSDLPTTGAKSLYAQLFLTRSVLNIDQVFDDPTGSYLTTDSGFVADHSLAVQAALNITADEIVEILQAQDVPETAATAKLSLGKVSLLYRHGLLAKALKLSIHDLIALKRLSGLDPFKLIAADPVEKIEDDYPLSQTLEFIDIAEEIRDSGMSVGDLDYVLRHRFDPVGKYLQDGDALVALVKALCGGVRQVLAQQAIPDDANAITNDLIHDKISLVFPADAVDAFMGFWADTTEFETVDVPVAAQKLDPIIYQVDRIRVVYDAVRKQQRVIHTGVLTAAKQAAILGKVPDPNADAGSTADQKQAYVNFVGMLDKIKAKSDQERKDFVNDYLKPFVALQPTPYTILYDAGGSPKATSGKTLLEAILPAVRDKFIRQFVTQVIAAHIGADPGFADAILNDLLKDPGDAAQPLRNAFDRAGISAAFFDAGDAPLLQEVRSTVDTAPKPAGTVRATFKGLLEVPSDGAYRFFITLGASNAEATLLLTDVSNNIVDKKIIDGKATQDDDELSAWIDLQHGILYPFSLELKKLGKGDASMLVQGESLSKGALDRLVLYPPDTIERVGRGRLLCAKVVQLAQGLGIDERELRYFLANAGAFENIDLNKIPTRKADDVLLQAQDLFKQFRRLARYAQVKKDVAGNTDDLVALLEQAVGGATLPTLSQRFADLTRRELATVTAMVNALGLTTAAFKTEKDLWRLWQALQMAERIGISVDDLKGATQVIDRAKTPAERLGIAGTLKSAVKACCDPDDWHKIAQPIYDKLRRRQRDTLVAYIMARNGFERLEQLFEYFLIDPGMEPVVQTSRVRLAIASTQLFIQRCLLNLEELVHPSAINSAHWQWMKRYRVWEANRKIFLYPENWLEPEFRDDKTHLFQELEGTLLQGDISNDVAEDAFFTYLKKLEALARLDVVAMYCEEKPDPELNTLHVIGRTYGEPRQYFYRSFFRRAWTPWEPVGAEIEGDHLVAVVWRDRLHLFWATFLEKSDPTANENQSPTEMGGTDVKDLKPNHVIDVQLNWSQYYQGEWTTREAGGFAKPVEVMVPDDFDKRSVFIHASKEYDTNGIEGAIKVHLHFDSTIVFSTLGFGNPNKFAVAGSSGGGTGPHAVMAAPAMTVAVATGMRFMFEHISPVDKAFRLAGRNSQAEPIDGEPPRPQPFADTDADIMRYDGGGQLQVSYVEKIVTEDGQPPKPVQGTKQILRQGGTYSVVGCGNPLTVVPPEIESIVSPFFYQDTEHTFFVEPTLTEKSLEQWEEWVISTPAPEPAFADDAWWKNLPVIPEVPLVMPPVPVDPSSKFQFQLKKDWLTHPATLVQFGDRVIGKGGGVEPTILAPAVLHSKPTGSLTVVSAGGLTPRALTTLGVLHDSGTDHVPRVVAPRVLTGPTR